MADLKMTAEQAADFWSTAVEGGSSWLAWGVLKAPSGCKTTKAADFWERGGKVIVWDREEYDRVTLAEYYSGELPNIREIGLSDWQDGLRHMSADYPEGAARLMCDPDECVEWDADDTDVLLQFAVFGELVFG